MLGEPTMEQKAKLLIAALDLGSPALDLTSVTASITSYIIVNTTNTTSPISRRSIPAICGTPSSEICKQSKYVYSNTWLSVNSYYSSLLYS